MCGEEAKMRTGDYLKTGFEVRDSTASLKVRECIGHGAPDERDKK